MTDWWFVIQAMAAYVVVTLGSAAALTWYLDLRAHRKACCIWPDAPWRH